MGDLAGRGFLVIGGAAGIGKAVALLACRHGATVLLSVPPGSLKGRRSAEDLTSAPVEEQLYTTELDISSSDEVERLFDLVADRLPGLHAFVMDLTADAPPFSAKSLLETTLSDWNEGLEGHLRQPYLLAQRALEEFLVGRVGGRIVFVLGSAGSAGTSTHVSVAAARSALAAFVRSVAKEYGRRNIACNAVVLQTAGIPCHGAAAETVLFLASDEASFVNGEILEVAS